jgi:hypothetical protein
MDVLTLLLFTTVHHCANVGFGNDIILSPRSGMRSPHGSCVPTVLIDHIGT